MTQAVDAQIADLPPAQRVRVRRRADRAALERDLRMADKLSDLLDSKFEVAGIRFGLDSIIGLLPGVGDVASSLIGLYPVYLAGRHELGSWTVARMLGNLGLDFLIGLVPLLGDAADVAFKANRRNFKLLRTAAERRHGVRLDAGTTAP